MKLEMLNYPKIKFSTALNKVPLLPFILPKKNALLYTIYEG